MNAEEQATEFPGAVTGFRPNEIGERIWWGPKIGTKEWDGKQWVSVPEAPSARNRYGFELVPPPQIPWPLWPIAIVGALVLAHVIDRMCSAKR